MLSLAPRTLAFTCASLLGLVGTAGCGNDDDDAAGVAHVQIKNDFNNPEVPGTQPPWTLCKVSYRDAQFGTIDIGATSATQDVEPGLDYVLMVAAWNDPGCDPSHALPIASKNKEEVVGGQTRTIAINKPNHQGPCPPEGVQPIPQEQYDRILALWPEFGFKPYAERTQNPQCSGSGGGAGDAGTGSDADVSGDAATSGDAEVEAGTP